ncbi:MAG: glutamate racemase [Chromatiaceae bacterium]|nr:glutamate racemase [Gammaproteobacteria bacterium]MCP5300616.1 glutamate racemase [Chromatiaceae bacterium]MCP5422688.1 glutamate racemase [Chromatiaceae bacterium]
MNHAAAIGFFDSGVGGLSVLRHAVAEVGRAPLLYVADSAYAPYGDRDRAHVLARSRLITRFLIEQGAAAVVVACNTATAVAVEALRAEFDVPIIGMEPALKPAARHSRSGTVAVLATAGTLRSERYARLVSDHGRQIDVLQCPCRHWVEAVEAGELDSPRVYDLINAELRPLQAAGVDSYVLGCTHFPFLVPAIRHVLGDAAALFDPGAAVVDQLKRRLGIVNPGAAHSPVTLYTSGDPARLQRHAHALIGLDTRALSLPF